MNLRIVGPTPLPDAVREALARPMINHRGPEFAELTADVIRRMQWAYQTRNEVLLLSCSGTGALEAAVANTISPGDRAVALCIGVFGDRFASIARAFGADLTRLDYEWGQPADPDQLRDYLRANPGCKAVLFTANETSTGVLNPVQELAAVIRAESDALVVVDAISALGAVDIPVDEWGLDVVLTGSQKAWMLPPGMAMASVSPRAWRAAESVTSPRFYFDFRAYRKSQARKQSPYTPPVGLFFALQEALKLIETEGLKECFQRHLRVARHTRQSVQQLGLELFPAEGFRSPTVTAIKAPAGTDADELRAIMRQEYDVVAAGGQQVLKGKILRFGHMGSVVEADMDDAVRALAGALTRIKVENIHRK